MCTPIKGRMLEQKSSCLPFKYDGGFNLGARRSLSRRSLLLSLPLQPSNRPDFQELSPIHLWNPSTPSSSAQATMVWSAPLICCRRATGVLLLEKRSVPGGAATTEEIMPEAAPGFRFNLCAIDHEFIHLSPVVEELQLKQFGLDYLYCDPVVFCPHPDGKFFSGQSLCGANLRQHRPVQSPGGRALPAVCPVLAAGGKRPGAHL